MSRLTKKYADSERYYSTHSCDEVLKKLGKLEDREEAISLNYISDGYADGYPVYDTAECPSCGHIFDTLDEHYKYCPYCGQKLAWKI